MKLSVSMSDEDVAFIDEYSGEHGDLSRSAVVQRALALLRARELADDYAAAWDEWAEGDAEAWVATAEDGLVPPSRP
jgi:Arc/MetJ-type ribon-helix-helix transcriptional regulator